MTRARTIRSRALGGVIFRAETCLRYPGWRGKFAAPADECLGLARRLIPDATTFPGVSVPELRVARERLHAAACDMSHCEYQGDRESRDSATREVRAAVIALETAIEVAEWV